MGRELSERLPARRVADYCAVRVKPVGALPTFGFTKTKGSDCGDSHTPLTVVMVIVCEPGVTGPTSTLQMLPAAPAGVVEITTLDPVSR
jgi:hypothetical protein